MNIFFIHLGIKTLSKLTITLVLVSIVTFTLVSMAPISPVNAYIGQNSLLVSAIQKEKIIAHWGLDRQPVERFFIWAGHAIRGDFGKSILFNESVTTVIMKRFLTSLWLMGLAWTFSGLFGFLLGMVAGMRQNSITDRIIRLYAYTLASTPTFWMGLVLMVFFSITLGWTPISGATPIGIPLSEVTLLQRLHHVVLPAATLSIVGIAQITLHTREKMIDAMNSDYALFAFAQGETRIGVAFRHALRNVALPAITLQFASLGELFGGSVLAEQVFSYPGLGQATVEAGLKGDVPLLLGITLFSAIFVFSGNFIADLLYNILDPRIRLQGGTAQC
jgi:peptide/nickel transport system permease protein